jgi:hypothetical protein
MLSQKQNVTKMNLNASCGVKKVPVFSEEVGGLGGVENESQDDKSLHFQWMLVNLKMERFF